MPKFEHCLILGGSGFIGSYVTEALIARGYMVSVLSRRNARRKNLLHLLDRIRIVEGDFNNEVELQRAMEGVDYVFHLISATLPATSNDNPIYDVEINLIGTLRLLNLCIANKIKKVVFVSSGGTVYGKPQYTPINEQHPTHPICSYGIVKKTIEDYLFMYHTLHGLDYTVLRLSNPYGERQNPYNIQGVIAVFLRKALNDEVIEIWGDGNVVRDYVYVRDVAEAFVKALEVPSAEKIFNIGSGRGYSLNELLQLISTIHGRPLQIRYLPPRKIDVPVNVLDISLARTYLGWQPSTSLQIGLKKFYDYLYTQRYAENVG